MLASCLSHLFNYDSDISHLFSWKGSFWSLLSCDDMEYVSLCPSEMMKITLPLFLGVWCLRRTACGILVPRPGIEAGPSAVKAPSPNHWPAREFPTLPLFKKKKFIFILSLAASGLSCDTWDLFF